MPTCDVRSGRIRDLRLGRLAVADDRPALAQGMVHERTRQATLAITARAGARGTLTGRAQSPTGSEGRVRRVGGST